MLRRKRLKMTKRYYVRTKVVVWFDEIVTAGSEAEALGKAEREIRFVVGNNDMEIESESVQEL